MTEEAARANEAPRPRRADFRELTMSDFRIAVGNAHIEAVRITGLLDAIQIILEQQEAPDLKLSNALSCLISIAVEQIDVLSCDLGDLTDARIKG